MIRGRTSAARIAPILAFALCAGVLVVPAVASAQPAVDEYSLDIPGAGGSEPVDPHDPGNAGAVASGSSGGGSSGGGGGDVGPGSGGGTSGGGSGTGEGSGQGSGQGGQGGSGEPVKYNDFHEQSGAGVGDNEPLDTSSRSAPEVVADTLLDDAMLPVLLALVVITGIGAWRVLRSRGTLTRQAG